MHHSRRATQKKAHSKKDAADRCAESCMLPWPWAVMIMGAWELAGLIATELETAETESIRNLSSAPSILQLSRCLVAPQ